MYLRYFAELKQYIPEETDPIEQWYDERYGYADQLQKFYIYANKCIVGFVILQYVDKSYGINPPIWYVVEFYILPEYRRKGFGIKTVETVLDMCGGNAFLYILKDNKPAMDFWDAAEFRLHLFRSFRSDLACDDGVEIRIIGKADC